MHCPNRYATSQTTAMLNTAAIPGDQLAVSNGISAEDRYVCSSFDIVSRISLYTRSEKMKGAKTSRGDKSNAAFARADPHSAVWAAASILGALFLGLGVLYL